VVAEDSFWEVFSLVFSIILGFMGYQYMIFKITMAIADRHEHLGWTLWLIFGAAAPAAMFVAVVHVVTGG